MVLPSRMGAGHALKAQAGSPASSRGPERGFAELWAALAFGGTAFPTSRLLAWNNLGIARNAEGSRVCLPLHLGNWQIRSQASTNGNVNGVPDGASGCSAKPPLFRKILAVG